jgi:membrane-associated protease RseP (regulator of RpoE activity)
MRLQRMMFALTIAIAMPAHATDEAITDDASDATRRMRAELREARDELRALTRRIGELQRELGGHEGKAMAFSYLSDPKRAMIGVVLDDRGDGVYIAAVTPGGPAEKAGVRAGDRLVSVDGQAIADAAPPRTPGEALRIGGDSERARALIAKLEPGQKVALVVERDGKRQELRVAAERRESWEWPMLAGDLGSLPAMAPLPRELAVPDVRVIVEKSAGGHGHVVEHDVVRDANREMRRVMIMRGGSLFDLRMAPVNAELGRYFGTDSGVLVLDKAAATLPAIRAGDVITSIGGQRVESTTDAMRALADHDAGSTVNIEVMRDRKRVVLAVEVPERDLMDFVVPVPPAPPAPPAAPAPPAPRARTVPAPAGAPAPPAAPAPPMPPPGRGTVA